MPVTPETTKIFYFLPSASSAISAVRKLRFTAEGVESAEKSKL